MNKVSNRRVLVYHFFGVYFDRNGHSRTIIKEFVSLNALNRQLNARRYVYFSVSENYEVI